MKRKLLSLFVVISCFLISCNDSSEEILEIKSKSKFKIIVENQSSDLNNYIESTTIQIISDDVNQIDIIAPNWNNIETPSMFAKWFSRQTTLTNKITYQTSEAVESITYSSVISPKENINENLEINIKIFADEKIVKEELFIINNELKTINIPIKSNDL